MGFMKPQVYETTYYVLETDIGDEILPSDLVGMEDFFEFNQRYDSESLPIDDFFAICEDFIEGQTVYAVTKYHGYLARLSAPGYMDCTDWSAHETEVEAFAYLEETYGDD